MSRLLLVFLLCFISNSCCIQIQTTKGKVEGEEVETKGEVVNVFKAIPFARPPVDELRFKKPADVDQWDDVYDSNQHKSPCPNGFDPSFSHNITEDCLYLSVFTDSKCMETPCPVVFYVQDLMGEPLSADDFRELDISAKFAFDRIVFVRPNYRMGVLGFLDIGTSLEEAPYNIGLHDLLMAMNFVHREIKAFGGDVDHITVLGSSYGADLSLLLLNSPKFREFSVNQGVVFNAMPSIGGGHTLNATQRVLNILNCEHDSDDIPRTPSGTLECLYNKSAEEIDEAVFVSQTPETYFGPRFDQQLLPANDQTQLRDLWRLISLLFVVHAPSFDSETSQSVNADEACQITLPYFGYYSNSTLQTCMEHYARNGAQTFGDAQYSYTVSFARMNTAKGADSYIGIVEEKLDIEDDTHFWNENATESDEESQIENRYNDKIRRFIKGLDGDWTTSDWHGAGYFHFGLPVQNDNSTEMSDGTMINDEYFNEPAIKFWLNDLAIEEASDSEEEETKIRPHSQEEVDITSKKPATKSGRIGAYSDNKSLAERELEVETVWMLFGIVLLSAIILAIMVIILCLCLLKERRGSRLEYRPNPVKFT